jgi:hypothetical protein
MQRHRCGLTLRDNASARITAAFGLKDSVGSPVCDAVIAGDERQRHIIGYFGHGPFPIVLKLAELLPSFPEVHV